MMKGGHDDLGTNFMEVRSAEIWEGKNVKNLTRFQTTLDFDRKYLPNGSRYRQADNSVIN